MVNRESSRGCFQIETPFWFILVLALLESKGACMVYRPKWYQKFGTVGNSCRIGIYVWKAKSWIIMWIRWMVLRYWLFFPGFPHHTHFLHPWWSPPLPFCVTFYFWVEKSLASDHFYLEILLYFVGKNYGELRGNGHDCHQVFHCLWTSVDLCCLGALQLCIWMNIPDEPNPKHPCDKFEIVSGLQVQKEGMVDLPKTKMECLVVNGWCLNS